MNVSVWEVPIRIYNTDLEPVIRALHEDSRQGGRVQIVLTKLKRGDRCVRRNPGAVFQHLKIKRKCVKLLVLAFPDRPQYHHVRSVSTIAQCRLQYDPDQRLCQPPSPFPQIQDVHVNAWIMSTSKFKSTLKRKFSSVYLGSSGPCRGCRSLTGLHDDRLGCTVGPVRAKSGIVVKNLVSICKNHHKGQRITCLYKKKHIRLTTLSNILNAW